MNRKKYLLQWAKKLADDDLHYHYHMKNPLEATPVKTFEAVLQRIRNGLQAVREADSGSEGVPFFRRGPIIRFAFGALGAAALIFIGIFLFFTLYQFPSGNNAAVNHISRLTGTIMITESGELKPAAAGDSISQDAVIASGGGSSALITIGRKSQVQMGENSKLKVLKLFHDNDIEKTRVFLEQGELHCRQVKTGNGSEFSVETETLILTVIGTEFTVRVKNHKTTVKVINGRVSIRPKISLPRIAAIRGLNSEIADRITEILEAKVVLAADEEMSITRGEVEKTEQHMRELLVPLQQELEKERSPDMEKIDSDLQKLNEEQRGLLRPQNNPSGRNISPSPEPDGNASMLMRKKTEIRIFSPRHKYYTEDPVLDYEIVNPGSVEIYLNGKEVQIKNNAVLSESVPGFNTLQIKSTDSDGRETEKHTDYFVNKLTLTELDDFNRPDSTSVGNNWSRLTAKINTRISGIRNNSLVFSGPTSIPSVYCVLFKTFTPSFSSGILQAVDITEFNANRNTSVFLQLGISGTGSINPQYNIPALYGYHGAAIHVVLETADGSIFYLQLQEQRYYPIQRIWDMSPKKTFVLDFSTPKRLVFYHKQRYFCGLLLDNDGTILQTVISPNYPSRIESSLLSFSNRKIAGYVPEIIKGNEVLVRLQNYYFYQGNK